MTSHEHHGVSNHWHLEFVQQLARAGNIKAPHYWLFVTGIHRWPVDFPRKGTVMWKAFPCHGVISFAQVTQGSLARSCTTSTPAGHVAQAAHCAPITARRSTQSRRYKGDREVCDHGTQLDQLCQNWCWLIREWRFYVFRNRPANFIRITQGMPKLLITHSLEHCRSR